MKIMSVIRWRRGRDGRSNTNQQASANDQLAAANIREANGDKSQEKLAGTSSHQPQAPTKPPTNVKITNMSKVRCVLLT
jgi:hypothetical protein